MGAVAPVVHPPCRRPGPAPPVTSSASRRSHADGPGPSAETSIERRSPSSDPLVGALPQACARCTRSIQSCFSSVPATAIKRSSETGSWLATTSMRARARAATCGHTVGDLPDHVVVPEMAGRERRDLTEARDGRGLAVGHGTERDLALGHLVAKGSATCPRAHRARGAGSGSEGLPRSSGPAFRSARGR